LRRDVERAPWDDFIEDFTRAHKLGDHVSIIGPTGEGKSTLGLAILEERKEARDSHIVIIATKPKDETLSRMGWPIITQWPPSYGQNQVILWPRFGSDPESAPMKQRKVIQPALVSIFNDGSRVVYFDEAWYLDEKMKLGGMIDQYLTQGRSNQLTVIIGTQRPRNVPRTIFSEPAWVFFFRTRDNDELKRVSEIGGSVDTAMVRDEIQSLEKYEFLCIRKDTGEMVRSKVE
jgi:energy-coupling factor transporter ATP-binding protein EcfA2